MATKRRLTAEQQDKRMHELLAKTLGNTTQDEWDELRTLTRAHLSRLAESSKPQPRPRRKA